MSVQALGYGGGALEDGARGQVEGDWEGVYKCEIDI